MNKEWALNFVLFLSNEIAILSFHIKYHWILSLPCLIIILKNTMFLFLVLVSLHRGAGRFEWRLDNETWTALGDFPAIRLLRSRLISCYKSNHKSKSLHPADREGRQETVLLSGWLSLEWYHPVARERRKNRSTPKLKQQTKLTKLTRNS